MILRGPLPFLSKPLLCPLLPFSISPTCLWSLPSPMACILLLQELILRSSSHKSMGVILHIYNWFHSPDSLGCERQGDRANITSRRRWMSTPTIALLLLPLQLHPSCGKFKDLKQGAFQGQNRIEAGRGAGRRDAAWIIHPPSSGTAWQSTSDLSDGKPAIRAI